MSRADRDHRYNVSEKGKARQARYSARETGKATRARYATSAKGKAVKAAADARYRASEKGVLARLGIPKS